MTTEQSGDKSGDFDDWWDVWDATEDDLELTKSTIIEVLRTHGPLSFAFIRQRVRRLVYDKHWKKRNKNNLYPNVWYALQELFLEGKVGEHEDTGSGTVKYYVVERPKSAAKFVGVRKHAL